MSKPLFKWDPSAFAVANIIGQLPDDIRRVTIAGINNIAEASVQSLQSNTPGVNLPKGWTKEVTETPAQYKQTVTNKDDRAYSPVKLLDGRKTNLVEMLEYGTRPHEITPKKAKSLRFVVGGKTVYAKHVEHPGTRPYGMVRIAYIEAAVKMAKLQKAVSRLLDQKVKK